MTLLDWLGVHVPGFDAALWARALAALCQADGDYYDAVLMTCGPSPWW